jgi:predicted nuclease with TOPRIM domain
LGEIVGSSSLAIEFRFDSSLEEAFPNRRVFDRALQATFSEGLKYTEIEDAKNLFIDEQFERSIQEMAESSSSSREAVLQRIASRVPAYQEVQRQNQTLNSRVREISSQLSKSEETNRQLQSEMREQQAEAGRLRKENAALNEKLENFSSQISKLGEENRSIKGNTQGYQKELESIQRSLKLRVDSSRDLSTQIADLGQAMMKMQKENQIQAQQIGSLQNNLDAQTEINKRLTQDSEELKSSNQKLQRTIRTLTSKEDSLARQYMDLKEEKEKLDDFSSAIKSLQSRVLEERIEDGSHYGKANVFLNNFLLGTLDWRIPVSLNHGQSRSAEAHFSAESVDTVQMTPEERQILRSLGEKLRIGLDITSNSPAMTVTGENESVLEVGEREQASWQWNINNQGTQDSRIRLSARLVNKDSNEIPLLQQENPVVASNAVRQFRGYLQPIPLVIGVILGFLLFGIVGIFRRPKKAKNPASASPTKAPEPPPRNGQKKL